MEIGYCLQLGYVICFFISLYLERTPIAFVAPYFDQIVAVVVMIFMLPESVKVLWNAIKEVFLFSGKTCSGRD